MLREVQSLIASHEQAESFIESPAIEVAAKIFAEVASSDIVGRQLSHYELKAMLGAGGMGEVYLAQDMRLGRQVALKLLPETFINDVERVRRFKQEARAASALNHPNILTIYEIERTEDKHFIAMEFIDGVTLREKIHGERTELGKLLKYLQQVAEGLAKAHAAGIVHRDLKPDNIMITRDDYAKILDFGLAKRIELQKPLGLDSATLSEASTAIMAQHSLTGTVMGTAGYMSPEQAQGKVKEIDHRSDIFSFGCILFEAATGQKPFAGESIIKSLHKVVYEAAPPIKDFNPSAPSDLQRVIRRCLAKDPDERYQTIKDVALEMKELRQGIARAAELDTTVPDSGNSETSGRSSIEQSTRLTSSAEYNMSEIKRHKRGSALALVTLMLAITGLAYYFYFAEGGKEAIDSVAVLPFKNMTKDPNTEYLSDGISESLINSLSQLPELKVIAQSSTFKYKGKESDVHEVALKETLELDQNFALPYVFLGYTYAAKGKYTEAIAAYQQFIKLSGDDPSMQIYLVAAYAKAGQREKAQAILKRLETTKEYVSPSELAALYIALGEREQAFASLERAYTAHDLQLQSLGVDPSFDSLRPDPRYQDIMRRVGLTP